MIMLHSSLTVVIGFHDLFLGLSLSEITVDDISLNYVCLYTENKKVNLESFIWDHSSII